MQKKFIYTAVFFAILTSGCSTDQNPLPSKSHPESWMRKRSPDFHGIKVMTAGHSSCQSCHGEDYQGGESETACFKCHPSYPHPGFEWRDHSDPNYHGQYIIDMDWNIQPCAGCHGEDFEGGRTDKSCFKCHGGYPHRSGWTQKGEEHFHGRFIRTVYWSMTVCRSCHGEDYRGGKSGSSCYTCHPGKGGPEACNVCHGSSENPAPPQDLYDHTDISYMGVGAHQVHVQKDDNCSLCHNTPQSVADAGHIDRTPHAEVNENRGWDRKSATCAHACHWAPNKSYIWNDFEGRR